MAGYSGTPLAKKLGIKEGLRVATVGAPDGFVAWLDPLPSGVEVRGDRAVKAGAALDVVTVFVTKRSDLERKFAGWAAAVAPAGSIWIGWPKRTSGVATDITEDVLREVILPTGYVDTKVCAISDVWSGLRFTLRKELRPR